MSKHLLPLIPAGLAVVQVLPAPDHITIVTAPQPVTALCPGCGSPSHRVHSRYERALGDLPWQGRPVTLRVQARRFRCLTPSCSRQTFSERLAGVAAVAARRTERLGGLQRHIGLALGGEAGARLAERLAMNTSPDTLLRMVGTAGGGGADPPATPRVLAVDDWAWRRGRRYGTVLVDLERNRVVDLLPDRQAETLAAWLRAHPGIDVIARDRAGAYADGARQGAPEAVQVADRWHLLRNLGAAVQALADRHGAATRRVARQVTNELSEAAATVPQPPLPTHEPNAAARASQASSVRRQARYEDAARLRAAGASISHIAALLSADRKTVRRWLHLGHAPLWTKPRRGSVLDAHAAYLDRRWAEGCRNAARLWRELVGLGFAGRPATVRAWATRRRQAEPRTVASATGPHVIPWQPPSGSQVARLLMANADTLPEAERAFVGRLLAEAPGLADAVTVAKRLNRLRRREGEEKLDEVLKDAAETQLSEFAAGLKRDLAAVQAALDTPWTTSPAEGQINRIKTIKRSMYGRAGFPLLRARVLDAA
ncbi:MAG: ISL3 family transposase [Geminicoccaceae bacterium]